MAFQKNNAHYKSEKLKKKKKKTLTCNDNPHMHDFKK
jgi:hypothetical protein